MESKHILIVDDTLGNLQLTGKILKEHGYQISLAQDGFTALKQMEQHEPQLILLDIMMPDMDGLEVCRRIKANERWVDIPVIFLTAKTQTEDLVEGFNSGGVDYITKPFNREELLVRVNNHLELADARKKIIQLNKNRDKLYSIIAHDLRSPFNAITQTFEALTDGVLECGSEVYFEIVETLLSRVSETRNLLDNLLNWTRSNTGKIEIAPNKLHIAILIDDVISLHSALAQKKQITVKNHIPIERQVLCDEITIHTVFRNLLANAIKFTPEHGEIHFESEWNTQTAHIKVRDTGLGMEKQVIEKILNTEEAHTSQGTQNEMGTGLGLQLVKDFVSINNGKLLIDSQLGVGTTFTMELPL